MPYFFPHPTPPVGPPLAALCPTDETCRIQKPENIIDPTGPSLNRGRPTSDAGPNQEIGLKSFNCKINRIFARFLVK